jgi:hypothetical protein
MSDELKPCPSCKGKCEPIKDPWGSRRIGLVFCLDSKCLYKLEAKLLEDAIRLHNSIPRGETCKLKYIGKGFWEDSCSKKMADPPSKYRKHCQKCGLKIEEVEGVGIGGMNNGT